MKKNILRTFLFAFLFLFLAFSVVHAKKGVKSDALPTLNQTADLTGIEKKDFATTVEDIILLALQAVGIVFFVLVIYAGFRWMIARGNEDQIETARKTLTAAAIGLIIIIASYAVTKAIVNSLVEGGTQVTGGDSQIGTKGETKEELGCCIAATSGGTYGVTLKTKALCAESWKISTYKGEFYSDVKDVDQCKKIFECWDIIGDLDGIEKADCLSKLKY